MHRSSLLPAGMRKKETSEKRRDRRGAANTLERSLLWSTERSRRSIPIIESRAIDAPLDLIRRHPRCPCDSTPQVPQKKWIAVALDRMPQRGVPRAAAVVRMTPRYRMVVAHGAAAVAA